MRQEYLVSLGLAFASVLLFGMAFLLGPVGFAMFYFSAMPLFVLGFLKGPKPVPLAATVGSALILFTAGIPLFMIYSIVIALPVMMAMRIALQAKPNTAPNAPPVYFGLGEVLCGLAITGSVVLVVTSAVLSSEDTGMKILIAQAVDQIPVMLDVQDELDLTDQLNLFKAVLPGVLGAVWVFNAVVNLLLAQRLSARYNPTHPVPTLSMQEMSLPGFYPFLLLIALVGSTVLEGEAGYAAFNAALMLAIPFVGLGFSVVHRFAHGRTYGTVILVGFYFAAFLSRWAPVLIAVLGVIEHFLQMRSAAQKRGSE